MCVCDVCTHASLRSCRWVCDPHRVRELYFGKEEKCLVYSIGSENKWDFEQSVHASLGSVSQSVSDSDSLTHSLSRTHALTHSHTRTHTLTHTHTHTHTHSPTHPLTHPLTHPPTHSLSHSFTHSLTAWVGVRCIQVWSLVVCLCGCLLICLSVRPSICLSISAFQCMVCAHRLSAHHTFMHAHHHPRRQ